VNLETVNDDLNDICYTLEDFCKSEHCDKAGKNVLKAICKRLDSVRYDVEDMEILVDDIWGELRQQLNEAQDKIVG